LAERASTAREGDSKGSACKPNRGLQNVGESLPLRQAKYKKSRKGLFAFQQLAKLNGKASTKVVYRGVTVIAGNGAPARADMAIVVDGDRIAAIVPVAQLTAAMSAGAEIVDANGQYALQAARDRHAGTRQVCEHRIRERRSAGGHRESSFSELDGQARHALFAQRLSS
jgi:hypothetical protein